MFCYPEHITAEMSRIFRQLQRQRYLSALGADEFARTGAHLLAELNAIPPFREGNGRTQLAYFALLAESADHPLNLERLDSNAFLQAVIGSFRGDETALAQLIRRLT